MNPHSNPALNQVFAELLPGGTWSLERCPKAEYRGRKETNKPMVFVRFHAQPANQGPVSVDIYDLEIQSYDRDSELTEIYYSSIVEISGYRPSESVRIFPLTALALGHTRHGGAGAKFFLKTFAAVVYGSWAIGAYFAWRSGVFIPQGIAALVLMVFVGARFFANRVHANEERGIDRIAAYVGIAREKLEKLSIPEEIRTGDQAAVIKLFLEMQERFPKQDFSLEKHGRTIYLDRHISAHLPQHLGANLLGSPSETLRKELATSLEMIHWILTHPYSANR